MSFLDILLYEREREREREREICVISMIFQCLVVDVQDVRQYSEHFTQLLKYTEQLSVVYCFLSTQPPYQAKKSGANL